MLLVLLLLFTRLVVQIETLWLLLMLYFCIIVVICGRRNGIMRVDLRLREGLRCLLLRIDLDVLHFDIVLHNMVARYLGVQRVTMVSSMIMRLLRDHC